MKRGEICLVDFDPSRGSEADKSRPAVIVSNDAVNITAERLGRGVITVVPITSRTATVHPFQVMLPAKSTGLSRNSKAQAEQARSVSVERLGRVIGVLTQELQEELDDALRLHLAL
jgi:mRNA interferase MazF